VSTRNFDPTSKYISWGSIKWHPDDVGCPLEQLAIIIFFQGLKALEEAGR
jgi:hypothetical protein